MIITKMYRGVASHFWDRLPEWYMAGQAMQFGAKLLQTGDAFSVSHAYDPMSAIMSENSWGFLMVLVAGIRTTCLFFNGSFSWFKRYSPTGRVLCAFISACVWFVVGSALYIGSPNGTAGGTYTFLFAFDIILAIRVSREAGTSMRRG